MVSLSSLLDNSYNCPFVMGDGEGGTEIHVNDVLKDNACVAECINRKSDDSSINGVSTRVGKGGCWCEKGMTGRKDVLQSCFIGKSHLMYFS